MLDSDYVLQYTPLILTVILAAVIAVAAFLIAKVMSPSLPESWKGTIYESGIASEPGEFAQMNIRYYLYAILFVLFEVEVLFILPWTVVVAGLGAAAFAEMMVFIGVLLFGLAYAWRKGVLQWR